MPLYTDQNCVIEIEDIQLDIHYAYTPSRRETRDPGGNITEPAEEATIDIYGIYLVDKTADIFDLLSSRSTIEDIEEKILELHNAEDEEP